MRPLEQLPQRQIACEYDPHDGWQGRPVWIEIDLDAVSNNVGRMRARLGPNTQIMAVVKANGYGLGALEMTEAALRGGASWLGVACADEGVELRQAGFTSPILILGGSSPREAAKIVAAGLRPTIHSLELAQIVSDAAQAQGVVLPVHIKLDSGLNRYGHGIEGFTEFACQLAALPGLQLEGLFTHFATADAPDNPYTKQQIERFETARCNLLGAGLKISVVHADNSAAAIGFAESHYDMIRMGITLSGEYPAPEVDHSLSLEQALCLKARITRISTLEPGDSVGYGRTFVAQARHRVALLPLGYADGYHRSASNKSFALVNGVRCPLIGRISMDQLSVDVSAAPDVQEGDEAVLFGRQGDAFISLDEVAVAAGTISYELLTHLAQRLPRFYSQNGKVTKIRTLLGAWKIEAQQSTF